MTWSPCLIRVADQRGEVRYELGDPLVDRYLRFVAGRARPNTMRATAFDQKTFFSVVAKDPLEVRSVDVFDFIVAQRIREGHVGDRRHGRSARETGSAHEPQVE